VPRVDAQPERTPEPRRLVERGERLGGVGLELPAGQMLIADPERALALLFGEPAAAVAVDRRSERITVCAVRVKGVPEISVEEALWSVSEMLMGS